MRWLLAGLLLVCNFPTHAVADDPQDPCNDIWEACEIAEDHPESDIIQRDVNGQLIWVAVARLSPRVGQSNRRALTAVDRPSTPFSLKTSNSGFGTEAGESNPQGVMKRTVWRRFAVDEPSRVVIHTYGSEVDTALAVYTGSRLNALTRIAFNDDAPVTGGEATSSLVSSDGWADIQRATGVEVGGRRQRPHGCFCPSPRGWHHRFSGGWHSGWHISGSRLGLRPWVGRALVLSIAGFSTAQCDGQDRHRQGRYSTGTGLDPACGLHAQTWKIGSEILHIRRQF